MKKIISIFLILILLCSIISSAYAESIYIVKPGDVLWKIAENYDTTWEELGKINNLQNPHLIYPGMELKVGDKKSSIPKEELEKSVYIGEGKGCYGTIQVGVTLEGDKIKDINILKHNESPGVGEIASKIIAEEIIKHQSIAVDVVAGCTRSSDGVLTAVEEALLSSGANIDDFWREVDTSTAQIRGRLEKEADVVIIGAGGAGLAAAVSAHQNGAKVLVLERMPLVGGNTIISGAAFNAVDPKRQGAQGIVDSIDKHYTQTYEGGDRLAKPELVKTLVENAYPAIEWLESMGMRFEEKVFTVLGALWQRSHKPVKPIGTGYIETYMDYINKYSDDIEIMVNTKATELIVENGRVVGAEAENPENIVIAKAKNGVIVATGGFSYNINARNHYNKMWPDLTNIKSTNRPGAMGDGAWMAEKIGANLIDMEQIQLLPMGEPETGSLSGNIEQGVEDRIFVNKAGHRFVDEGARRDVMTKALFEQEDSLMWVIVDKHSYPTGNTKNNFDETIDFLVEEGIAFKGDTLEELALQIGADPANLLNAVNTFNKAVSGEIEDPFGRTLFDNKLDTPPYYAGSRMPTVHHTMGGIEINTKAQVLDTKGDIIKGLFAAGEVTGGIHGTNRLGGNAVPDTVVFGKIAGESAAKNTVN